MGYSAPTPGASGVTFTQLQAKGFSGHIEALMAAQAATSNPTAAGTIATGTTYGGLLPPGAYLLNFTETNGFGETLPSTESASFTLTRQTNPSNTATGAGAGTTGSLPAGVYRASYTYVDAVTGESTPGTSESVGVTITSTQVLTITFNDTSLPAWAASRNLYLTVAGGASGSETLYATGITTATYACSSASWVNGTTTAAAASPIPGSNTTSTNQPVVTLPALQTNNVGRNLYLTAPGGTTGTETLYQAGITTTTFTMNKALTLGAKALPTANNTTMLANGKMVEFTRYEESRRTGRIFDRARTAVYEFLYGSPVSQQDAIQRFKEAHAAIAIYDKAMTEIGTLMDANPCHIINVTQGSGGTGQKRVWP
jgi:hypothetical protein